MMSPSRLVAKSPITEQIISLTLDFRDLHHSQYKEIKHDLYFLGEIAKKHKINISITNIDELAIYLDDYLRNCCNHHLLTCGTMMKPLIEIYQLLRAMNSQQKYDSNRWRIIEVIF